MTASEIVGRLRRHEVSPLELLDALEKRIAAVDGEVNALPTLCFDRARAHAQALMHGQGRDAEGEAGWLAGLPVPFKDLADVAGVRTTHGSPIYRDHVPTASRQEARAMAAAAMFERVTGLAKLLPIDPRAGTVPQ